MLRFSVEVIEETLLIMVNNIAKSKVIYIHCANRETN